MFIIFAQESPLKKPPEEKVRKNRLPVIDRVIREGDRGFSGTNWGSFADFTVSSYYIFLCGTNPMDKLRDVRREVFCVMSKMV
jgi:hypothetical protein